MEKTNHKGTNTFLLIFGALIIIVILNLCFEWWTFEYYEGMSVFLLVVYCIIFALLKAFKEATNEPRRRRRPRYH